MDFTLQVFMRVKQRNHATKKSCKQRKYWRKCPHMTSNRVVLGLQKQCLNTAGKTKKLN